MTTHAALLARIAAAADAIIERALAAQYADPFWHARYGDLADRRGREDGHFHLQYVAQALRERDPGVMTTYARWLQQLLTTRGMCTLHIVEHFERMAAAITDHVGVEAKPVVALFDAGTAALAYPRTTPAGALQERSAEVVATGAAQLVAAHPGAAARAAHDVALLVSYAADALARGGGDPTSAPVGGAEARGQAARLDTFDAHVAWLEGFLATQGAPAGYAADLVATVRASLPAT